MRTLRPTKRSVSPFGSTPTTVVDPFANLRESFLKAFPPLESETKPQLKSIEDARFVPDFIEKISNAPANDAPDLEKICHFLILYNETLTHHQLAPVIFEAMLGLFERKTDLFMIDHRDRAHFEKMGLPLEYQDLILFSKERDALVGRFFAPLTETHPGTFSEFITRWMETDNPDRILHFLDFCAGAKNPTFEHYLLFTHPALARVITNKPQLRTLFEKAHPLLSKLSSPTWEKDVRQALGVS